MEAGFWQRQRIWTIADLHSTTTLWIAITLLALFAIYGASEKSPDWRWAEEDGEKDDDFQACDADDIVVAIVAEVTQIILNPFDEIPPIEHIRLLLVMGAPQQDGAHAIAVKFDE
jgi:hypothetical protein